MSIVCSFAGYDHICWYKFVLGPGLLCSKFYLLCFWALLKKLTHYAQYYAHESKKYATINWDNKNLNLLLE